MSYSTQDTAANDPGFQVQVRQAMFTTALQVVAENPTAANHSFRLALARTVLAGNLTPGALAAASQAVVNDGVTTTTSTDADILARVQSLWSALSGV